MAYDWTGLLGEIEAFSAHRASSLVDEDKELRRLRATGVASSAREPGQRFVPTGIARKAAHSGLSGLASSSEPTIASILQAPKGSQRGIIELVGSLGAAGRDREDEDEPRALAGGGGGGASAVTAARAPRSTAPRHAAMDRAAAETASRAAIAAGAQPVVIKVTSTVSSRASAASLMTYLGTREVENENGEKAKVDISIYDQDGVATSSREDRATVLAEWTADFREAYAVNAVATFSMRLTDNVDDAVLHDALHAAFSSKPFLYSRHPDGQVSVFAVTDLPAKRIAGALKARAKGEGPARVLENAEADFVRRLADAGVLAEVRILGAAVSEKSGRYFLEKFLRTEKTITTSEGDPVKRGSSVKDKAEGIWRAWSSHIRTVEPRNAFHVIFSARAGTDPEAMTRAVRDFLSEQAAGHRWITAHHPETGHVHVHAMISARDDVGKALRLTKPELYEWRERFAAKAREHGIAMVATRRADVAATRPYSQAQAGAYERGRQDHRYLKTPALTKRVERKRAGVVDRASLTNGNLALVSKWRATAGALKRAGAEPSVIAAADRFAAAAGGKDMQVMELTDWSGSLLQQKETAMPLSLEQFDARVLRATKSMDRLEMTADSSAERQAVEALRKELSALFAEQRRDIEKQQVRSISETVGGGEMSSAPLTAGARVEVRAMPPAADPAIAAQQQAIAAGRAARAAREQASAAKAAQDEQRQQVLRQAEQKRQRDKGRDGAER
jgi:hypothetical protein